MFKIEGLCRLWADAGPSPTSTRPGLSTAQRRLSLPPAMRDPQREPAKRQPVNSSWHKRACLDKHSLCSCTIPLSGSPWERLLSRGFKGLKRACCSPACPPRHGSFCKTRVLALAAPLCSAASTAFCSLACQLLMLGIKSVLLFLFLKHRVGLPSARAGTLEGDEAANKADGTWGV